MNRRHTIRSTWVNMLRFIGKNALVLLKGMPCYTDSAVGQDETIGTTTQPLIGGVPATIRPENPFRRLRGPQRANGSNQTAGARHRVLWGTIKPLPKGA